jgi:hypothetical protein
VGKYSLLFVVLLLGCDSGPPTMEEACAGCEDDVRKKVCQDGYRYCAKTEGCDLEEYATRDVPEFCGK